MSRFEYSDGLQHGVKGAGTSKNLCEYIPSASSTLSVHRGRLANSLPRQTPVQISLLLFCPRTLSKSCSLSRYIISASTYVSYCLLCLGLMYVCCALNAFHSPCCARQVHFSGFSYRLNAAYELLSLMTTCSGDGCSNHNPPSKLVTAYSNIFSPPFNFYR